MRGGEPCNGHRAVGHQDPRAPHEPRPAVALEQDVVEAVGALEVEDQQSRRQREEQERDERRHDAEQKARRRRAEQRGEGRDHQRSRRDRLRPQVRRDLPAPRARHVRHVVDGTAQRGIAVLHPLHRRHHADEIHFRLGPCREGVVLRLRLHRWRESRRVGAEIEHLGPRALLGLAHLDLLGGHEARDGRARIVEVACDDRLHGADDHARGLEPHLHAMGAVVALRGGVRARVDVERVVGAGLHARLAADAPLAVEVHDAVAPPVERDGGADRDARGVVAVVAAEDREVAPGVRIVSTLDVLHPCAEGAERNAILFLARHGAGVATDALPLIDDEPVAHARVPLRCACRSGIAASAW